MIADKYKQMTTETNSDVLLCAEEQGLYADLTYRIIGALYEVHNDLGFLYKEIVYRKAVAVTFKEKGIQFIEEGSIPIIFKGSRIGVYRPDFVIEDKVILELKVASSITNGMLNQIFYYMKGSRYQLALLANFGTNKLMIKRRIFTR